MTDKAIEARHRGLLPFRAWQLFDAMVDFVSKGDMPRFVCAAGVLTHYIGDACQPLHISYLHDGDPLQKVTYTFKKGKREGEQEERPFGQGVHTAYEDTMISAFRETILEGLRSPPKARKEELVENGFEAALQTVAMMRKTFRAIPPAKIVDVFASFEGPPSKRSKLLWERFGKKTIGVMQDGAHLLAVLWESAWAVGEGEKKVSSTRALTESEAMRICADEKFVPSVTIDKIGSLLSAAP
jgi:hypothetical protein